MKVMQYSSLPKKYINLGKGGQGRKNHCKWGVGLQGWGYIYVCMQGVCVGVWCMYVSRGVGLTHFSLLVALWGEQQSCENCCIVNLFSWVFPFFQRVLSCFFRVSFQGGRRKRERSTYTVRCVLCTVVYIMLYCKKPLKGWFFDSFVGKDWIKTTRGMHSWQARIIKFVDWITQNTQKSCMYTW